MSDTTNPGIDHSSGQSNIDHQTGIRFGVISQNSILQNWADSSEPDYGNPTCPKCGNDADEPSAFGDTDFDADEWEHAEHECDDYVCTHCKYLFGSESGFGDEALGYYLDDGEHKMVTCLDSDIMILKSPYYTYAQFCSPCVPGAGNLECPLTCGWGSICEHTGEETGCSHFSVPRCYALGHEWFEEQKAPYPVYSVETNLEIKP